MMSATLAALLAMTGDNRPQWAHCRVADLTAKAAALEDLVSQEPPFLTSR